MADKARNAVMTLIFAMSGLMGPSKPFEGERGSTHYQLGSLRIFQNQMPFSRFT